MKFIQLTNKIAFLAFLVSLLGCHRDEEYRDHLKFKDETKIVTKNIMQMDSLISVSPFKDGLRSIYTENKNDSLIIYINRRVYMKHKYQSNDLQKDYTNLNEFDKTFLRITLCLYNNNISLIFSPCGFLEFVFYYSNNRGMHRSIIIKKKEITAESLKACNLHIIDSSDHLLLAR